MIKDTNGVFQLAELTPEQVLEDWSAISEGISLSFPPTNTNNSMEEILPMLTSGSMKCWVFSEGDKTWVLLTLLPILDYGSRVPNLLVYSVYAYKPVSLQKWTTIIGEIKKYAKVKGFHSLIAFSNVERIINMVEILGWDTSYRVLKLEVI